MWYTKKMINIYPYWEIKMLAQKELNLTKKFKVLIQLHILYKKKMGNLITSSIVTVFYR